MLVLASPADVTACGVYGVLREWLGEERVMFITEEELALAPCWEQRLGEGKTGTRVRLADGTRLDDRGIRGVFNRLQVPDLPQFLRSSEADRLYALGEVAALWLSWLAALPCPVVNPPSPWSLPGPEFPLLQWLDLASRAGLPGRGCTFSSDPRVFFERGYIPHRISADGTGETVFEPVCTPPFPREPTCFFEPVDGEEEIVLVSGRHRIGRLGERFSAGLDRLSARAGCNLLQVSFRRSVDTGEWLVTNVTSFPVTEDPVAHRAIALLLAGEEVPAA
ncbi:MAG TPA: hypothetical protein PK089_06525 [Methanoregulaceae archaeon]|nr:hypothetical protein [Methanoregulaceae archaeon]HQJ87211.1 hypothetical protein [Methanoregulaceae archaeon]